MHKMNIIFGIFEPSLLWTKSSVWLSEVRSNFRYMHRKMFICNSTSSVSRRTGLSIFGKTNILIFKGVSGISLSMEVTEATSFPLTYHRMNFGAQSIRKKAAVLETSMGSESLRSLISSLTFHMIFALLGSFAMTQNEIDCIPCKEVGPEFSKLTHASPLCAPLLLESQ